MRPLWGIAAAVALSTGAALAQETPDQAKAMKAKAEIDQMLRGAKVIGLEASVMGPAVKGAPYSADEIHETTQVLADGTRIHNETKTTIYRDSQGRVRRESPGQVMIWDSAAGTSYMLNQSDQTAQKMHMAVNYVYRKALTPADGPPELPVRTFQFPDAGPGAAPGGGQIMVMRSGELRTDVNVTAAAPAGATTMVAAEPKMGWRTFTSDIVSSSAGKAKKENLESQIMEGLKCEGVRTTNTIETGAIGNDRPIQTVEERWYSPELSVNTLVRRTDPRTGEDITRLTNVRRIEPDPSLFSVPPSYQLKQ